MILKYGSYQHSDGECILRISRQAVRAASGIPVATVIRWDVEGNLLPTAGSSDPVSELTTKITALENAYKYTGVDAYLLTSSGAATAHSLRNSEAIGGVQVVSPPFFPVGEGADYATYRRYALSLEAEIPIGGADNGAILQWQETIQVTGGLPQYAFTRPIFGIPQRQIVRKQTTYRAIQTGMAIGYVRRPVAPVPLWGAALVNQTVGTMAPQSRGNGSVEFGVQWSYEFESATPLIGEATPQYVVPL